MMAKGNPDPNKATRWQPGNSGNPNGRPTLKKILKRVGFQQEQAEDHELVRKIISGYLLKTVAELRELNNNSDITGHEKTYLTLINIAMVHGDPRIAGFLLSYLIGKPKERIEHTGLDGGPVEFAHMSLVELKEHAKRSMIELKDLISDEGEESEEAE